LPWETTGPDEDMVEALPKETCTIKVGEGPSHARFSLTPPADVRVLLTRLASGKLSPLFP